MDPDWFFDRLQKLKSEGHLVDVSLCAEGREVPCHRLVLSACSDYFCAMFSGAHSESKMDKIEIGGVDPESLQLLVDFAYTSKFNITPDNVYHQFEAANMLQIKPVEDACEKFLSDNLSSETCLGTWAVAEKVSCIRLSAKAKNCALKDFEDTTATEEFLQLPVDFLKRYISDEGLHVKKEKQVLEVIIRWARHSLEERQPQLKELLKCVSFSCVDQEYLKSIMETGQILAGVPGIEELIKDQPTTSTHPTPRRILQEEILLLGGVTGCGERRRVSSHMYRLDLHFDCEPSNTTLLPQSLHCTEGSAVCVVGNDVILTGGDESLTEAWRYQSSLDSWTKLGSLNTGRCYHGMAALNGEVYAVGGDSDRKDSTSVEVYSMAANSWKETAPLKLAVSHFGIATCGDKIYVFGGMYGMSEETTDALQCYDPNQNEWTFAAVMPKAVSGIRACTVNSKIYLVGGQLESVVCYSPHEDRYEKMADREAPWDHCSASVCGSEIYITGGCCNVNDFFFSTPHGLVQCYDVCSDTMTIGVLEDLPVPLHGHHTVTISKH
ncbi:PREDICTED: kelch-like protein 24 [Branchiostoma belcheri]|uniref:Kelch-like protein 24 n=1 Tax=Branchiostoma belcheri TaxID=7741 RepID=A0A6P4Z8S2_BRABE|nr:PREDICTED: kelch-like protein 24 [Branchiostoma belcheri]